MLSVPHFLKSPCLPLVGEFLSQRLGTVGGDIVQWSGAWTLNLHSLDSNIDSLITGCVILDNLLY